MFYKSLLRTRVFSLLSLVLHCERLDYPLLHGSRRAVELTMREVKGSKVTEI
jgi:hypothetical protein